MYTIKQRDSIVDTLALERRDGTVEKININLRITPDIASKFRKEQLRLIELQKQGANNPETIEKIGEVIVNIMDLIFGEDGRDKIITFFDGDYTAMMLDIFPYIQNVVIPALQNQAAEMRKKFKRRKW